MAGAHSLYSEEHTHVVVGKSQFSKFRPKEDLSSIIKYASQ